ncbi:hypothetical protein Fcan01_16051 [Folsomia candida]|uniref:Chitin-binding type-2 domain-containing protein n=1 Tax=Folsomia candida TaxID=158441 RepID=A0A226DW54_FOLCA|nr:hypothetical protein Fcan01_16051 [Folsomia candida]
MMTLTLSLAVSALVLLQVVHFSKCQLPTLPSLQIPQLPSLSINGSINLSPTVPSLLPVLDSLIPTIPPIDILPFIRLPINQTKFTCPTPFGIFPDVEDCHTYFVCVLNLYIRKKCLFGKYFKPDDVIFCQEYDSLQPPPECSPCHRFTTPQTCPTQSNQCSFCVGQNFTGQYR